MARISLSLFLPVSSGERFVATWDILSEELEVVARGAFLSRQEVDVSLSPGSYWARILLPSGEVSSRKFKLDHDAAHLDLPFMPAQRSRHEWLSWVTFSESLAGMDESAARIFGDFWARSWTFEGSGWLLDEQIQRAEIRQDESLMQLELGRGRGRLLALQLGGRDIASRFVILPEAARILITPVTLPGQSSARPHDIELHVSLESSVADHLARFLTMGGASQLRAIDVSLLSGEGMALLEGKLRDPLGAAVGGYFLLQHSQPPPLDWLQRLSRLSPWLADSAILYASALLRYRGRAELSQAGEYLHAAAQRGYPVLQRGIEMFLDARRVLVSSKVPLSAEVEAYALLCAAARAHGTRQTAFTTFYGTAPNAPGGVRPDADPNGLLELNAQPRSYVPAAQAERSLNLSRS